MSHLQLIPNGMQQFADANGAPYALGTVQMLIPNTMTDKDTWQDRDHVALNTNPISLDAAGRCVIWGDGAYRQILKDVLGNTVWDKITQMVEIETLAPADASYLTIDDEGASLTGSRQLVAGSGVTFVDGGAGGTLEISADPVSTDVSAFQQALMGGI